MRNYKVTISYDGSAYKGWQRQALTSNTIQNILEETASELLGYPVELDGSGRTDAGVHAIGQVANMKTAGLLGEDFREKWNDSLPEDIRICKLELMKGGFHGRYSAVSKRYCYIVDTREIPNVFQRRYACHYPKQLDIDVMRVAAEQLKGTHDFSAFTDDKSDKSKIRTIYDIAIHREETMLKMEFYGDGFLYHMVRILSGTLLQIGCGEKEDVASILKSKERSQAGFLAPAKGLFLKEVYYK